MFGSDQKGVRAMYEHHSKLQREYQVETTETKKEEKVIWTAITASIEPPMMKTLRNRGDDWLEVQKKGDPYDLFEFVEQVCCEALQEKAPELMRKYQDLSWNPQKLSE